MNNVRYAKLNRESTKITISEFYERHLLNKYNYEPKYQRKGDVWSEEKQSFLIDSILKNYPMPPIFLHQIIDTKTGATRYNVIDGKQRLTTILKFIDNNLELPSDYDDGAFGDSRLNSKKFEDLNGDLEAFKMQFWRYVLSVEYIEADDTDIINNVFDRLNRNGEPLEPQELRKAKYSNTLLMNIVDELVREMDWSNLKKVKINRMQDAEFVSELIFYLLENSPMDASKKENMDEYYEKWSKNLTEEVADYVKNEFKQTINFLATLTIDFDGYKINGVSHFYALFVLANYCVKHYKESEMISMKLNEFYGCLRNGNYNDENVRTYWESMQANTRSKRQRIKRLEALVHYCTGSTL
ncbi:MAG: DUF262 domain-containing protein [Phascolarctobacterium sp.]|nr:DUF262 domain-containing protein [Phascolarctobacterium sp.]